MESLSEFSGGLQMNVPLDITQTVVAGILLVVAIIIFIKNIRNELK